MDRETGKYSAVAPDKPTDATYIDQFVGCSSDTEFVYYIHSEESKPICQVIARDANGTDHQLYSAPNRLPWTAALSPDGSRLAAVSRALHRELIVLPTSGNGLPKVIYKFDQEGEYPTWLAWTPDGRSIFFTRRDHGSSLWRISAEGGEPQNLGIRAEGIRGISVHPDGKQLAFSALVPGTGASELWVLEGF
jgi:Tol biopolymer transport system component